MAILGRSSRWLGQAAPAVLCLPIQVPGDVVLLAETDGLHDTLSGGDHGVVETRLHGFRRCALCPTVTDLGFASAHLRKDELYRKQRVA